MQVKEIDVHTLDNWLENDEAIIIDVREPDEYAEARIDGATLIPLGTITSALLPETDKKIVIQCRKGIRSFKACQNLLIEDNSLDLYNLAGGIEAWIHEGFPIK